MNCRDTNWAATSVQFVISGHFSSLGLVRQIPTSLPGRAGCQQGGGWLAGQFGKLGRDDSGSGLISSLRL